MTVPTAPNKIRNSAFLVDSAAALPISGTSDKTRKQPVLPQTSRPERLRTHRPNPWLIAAAVGIPALVGGYAAWRMMPISVPMTQPHWSQITETIAASGLVGGYREVTVGSQANGVVKDIRVAEGAHVTRGQVLAVVQDGVVVAQVHQARQALQTTVAQLRQQAAAPLPSEINTARFRAEQARETLRAQQLAITRALAQVEQANAQTVQAEQQIQTARADRERIAAQCDLAQKTLERMQALYLEGAVARQNVDQAQTEFTAALKNREVADNQIDVARTNLWAAQAAQVIAAQDEKTARAQAAAQEWACHQAQSDLLTLKSQPRPEPVAVAKQRVRDAETSLKVALAQAHDTLVRAPFDGVVTAITGQPGASVMAGGVIRLVGTEQPEIRIDIDENDLGSLNIGQEAVITSTAYANARAVGKVRRIGAQVNSASGTIQVAIGYDSRLPWLRPGQTVNVNLVTSPHARRQLIPISAVKHLADRNVVFLIEKGRAVPQTVTLGQPVGSEVPVFSGLSEGRSILASADRIEQGQRVRAVVGR